MRSRVGAITVELSADERADLEELVEAQGERATRAGVIRGLIAAEVVRKRRQTR